MKILIMAYEFNFLLFHIMAIYDYSDAYLNAWFMQCLAGLCGSCLD